MRGLFKSDRTVDALHVLEEMLERDFDFPPDDFTGEVIFGEFGKWERSGRSFGLKRVLLGCCGFEFGLFGALELFWVCVWVYFSS